MITKDANGKSTMFKYKVKKKFSKYEEGDIIELAEQKAKILIEKGVVTDNIN